MDLQKKNGAPERIRTSDPQIRSLVLYPAELRARSAGAVNAVSGAMPRAAGERLYWLGGHCKGPAGEVFEEFHQPPAAAPEAFS